MLEIHRNIKLSIESNLFDQGYRCTNDAFRSFRRINFSQLSALNESELIFLKQLFNKNIIEAHDRRAKDSLQLNKFTNVRARHRLEKISSRDVRSAMIFLGNTIKETDDSVLSTESVLIVSAICPYCVKE